VVRRRIRREKVKDIKCPFNVEIALASQV